MPLRWLLVAAGAPWRSSACRGGTLISASVFAWLSPLCIFFLSFPISSQGTCHWI